MPDVLATLMKLPEVVFTRLNTTKEVIGIKRGMMGYVPITTPLTPEELNEGKGITKAQIAAMEAGSMFGWELPAADPDNYNADGSYNLKRFEQAHNQRMQSQD